MSGLGDKPAFPGEDEFQNPNGPNIRYPVPGMTYREWLIGRALTGLCADPGTALDKTIGEKAIQAADFALSALEEPPRGQSNEAGYVRDPRPGPAGCGSRRGRSSRKSGGPSSPGGGR